MTWLQQRLNLQTWTVSYPLHDPIPYPNVSRLAGIYYCLPINGKGRWTGVRRIILECSRGELDHSGKEASAQKGFNVGFKESVVVGYDWGLVRGVTGALNCLPGKLSEKIIESQETKTKFHNLYESMNNLSTTDALKLYNDDLSKTRVREGKQNSDGSVLDSYHQQLRSLVLESPAIRVQFRDKSIAVLSTGKDPSLE
ncbi:essential protein Yae1 [Tanacetum coccineum]